MSNEQYPFLPFRIGVEEFFSWFGKLFSRTRDATRLNIGIPKSRCNKISFRIRVAEWGIVHYSLFITHYSLLIIKGRSTRCFF